MSDSSFVFEMQHPAPMIYGWVIKPRPERTVKGEKFASQYEGTILFPQDHLDLPQLRKQLAEVASGFDKFAEHIAANKAAGRSPYDGIKFPLTNGTAEADAGKAIGKDYEFKRGMGVFQASAGIARRDGTPLSPPRLKVLQDGKFVRYDENERALAGKFFYSGVLVVGTFALSPWKSPAGMGVKAYLNEILSINSGEKIVTGADDEARYGSPDRFSKYVGKVSSVNPAGAAALDDEIPF